jgi:hypothetical protein
MDIINNIKINAPVNTAWQVLGEEFGEISGWADPVLASSLDRPLDEGVVRTCDIKATGPFPAGQITETLSEFNRQKKILTYLVKTGGPPFVSDLQNRWILEGRDATSSIANSTISYRLKWWAVPFAPLIAIMMKKATAPIFAQFREAVQARFQADRTTGDAAATLAWSRMA